MCIRDSFMFMLEKLSDKHNINWLKPFAMPFSMILAMILVMILAKVLPSGIATAERSMVVLVAVSKVLMPRSQSITFWLPSAIMYSALIRNS